MDGRKVVLSFDYVETVIGRLHGEFQEEQIRKLLSAYDTDADELAVLKGVVENAKACFMKPNQFD